MALLGFQWNDPVVYQAPLNERDSSPALRLSSVGQLDVPLGISRPQLWPSPGVLGSLPSACVVRSQLGFGSLCAHVRAPSLRPPSPWSLPALAAFLRAPNSDSGFLANKTAPLPACPPGPVGAGPRVNMDRSKRRVFSPFK